MDETKLKELHTRLEGVARERRITLEEKRQSNAGYKETLDGLDESEKIILSKIDELQHPPAQGRLIQDE